MIQFTEKDCIGCGACMEPGTCKGGAFHSDDGNYSAKFDESKCVSCDECYVEAACLGEAVIKIDGDKQAW
jgi:Fe-S-cluster-containing hydrogenase component 2